MRNLESSLNNFAQVESRWEAWERNLTDIEQKLNSGVQVIKKGHSIKKLNPTGEEIAIPLSYGQRVRLGIEANNLRDKLNLPLSYPWLSSTENH